MDGTAKEILICGKSIKLGDYVKVRYTTGTWSKGCTLTGNITELWFEEFDGILQARVNNGWCFHDYDEIIEHKPA